MLDCGSHGEKECPVRSIIALRDEIGWLGHMKKFHGFPLTHLVLSHPDEDHINNLGEVRKQLPPYLLTRQYHDHYLPDVDVTDEYKGICQTYRAAPEALPSWSLDCPPQNFFLSLEEIRADEELCGSLKNNSSVITVISSSGIKFLFGGDLEEAGWRRLLKQPSVREAVTGTNVLIASHHGHSSGYSPDLMAIIRETLDLVVASKGMEGDGETDVSSRYSEVARGYEVTSLANKKCEKKYMLSTRQNGNIYFTTDGGKMSVLVTKGI